MRILNIDKIVELRTALGWDQKQLAQAANIARSVVSRLEKGNQTDFKLSIVVALAKALGVSVDTLLVDSAETYTTGLVPDLQSVLFQLKEQPETVQKQIARIIRGYLSPSE